MNKPAATSTMAKTIHIRGMDDISASLEVAALILVNFALAEFMAEPVPFGQYDTADQRGIRCSTI